MAQFSRTRQPRYTTGRRRRSPRGRRTRPASPAPKKRRGPTPILIIAAVIVALIFCWVFGRGCGGNKEAKENEKLRVYTSDVNKLIQRSAGIGTQFDNLRNGIEDLAKEDVSRKLSQMVEDCKDVAKEAKKVEVPEKAESLQPLLELSFDMRSGGVDKFRTAIMDVLNEKNTESVGEKMTEGLMDLVVSDESMQRFRGSLESKLKAAKLSYEKVADSKFVPTTDDALSAGVLEYISELGGAETGDKLHGVAVGDMSISPARVDRTESGLSILPYSGNFTVKVAVQNQGNQVEEDIPVVVTLSFDSGETPQKKTQKITRLKPNETTTVVIEGLKPVTGGETKNILKVKAGPVEHEKKVDNNERKFSFIMLSEES